MKIKAVNTYTPRLRVSTIAVKLTVSLDWKTYTLPQTCQVSLASS